MTSRPIIGARTARKVCSAVRSLLRPRKSARSADKAARAKSVEPVIPLVHAPDDPGTETGLDADPLPEPAMPQATDAWQRIRGLFR